MVQLRLENKGSLELGAEKRSPALAKVIHINRHAQIRQEIGMIADRSFREKVINSEAYEGYREIAEGREKFELQPEMLESTRKFASEHEARAIKIHRKIESAMRSKIASETDEDRLMGLWIRDNMGFLQNASEVERIIEGKLERLARERKRYDALCGHKLIKDKGYLKVNASTRLPMISEEDYLEMTVPERREFLEKMEKALPEAENYAKNIENKENSELDLQYQGKLFEMRRQKVIGRNTFHKFLNAFKGLKESSEKEYWLSEFDNEMERYKVLQHQIRSTLRGAALKRLEAKLDDLGYTQMLEAFGKEKNAENNKLNERFAQALEYYRDHGIEEDGIEKGIIGDHTIEENIDWIQSQDDIANKYDIISKVPDEMQRYQNLWSNINKLPKAQRDDIRANIDKWGYTEMKAEYERYKRGDATPANPNHDKTLQILNQVRDSRAKEAIVETGGMLKEKGKNTLRSVSGILRRMFGGMNREQFDAENFNKQVQERVKENQAMLREKAAFDAEETQDDETQEQTVTHSPGYRKTANDKLYSFEVDEEDDDVDDEIDVLEDWEGSEVTKQYGVVQVETWDADEGKVHREAQFTMNTENGIERLIAEDRQHHYQSEANGGRDDLSIAFQVNEETVEMDYASIRTAEKYFEALDEAANDGDYGKEEEKKAA